MKSEGDFVIEVYVLLVVALAVVRVGVSVVKAPAVIRVLGLNALLREAAVRVARAFVLDMIPHLHLKQVRLPAGRLARQADLELHQLEVDDRAVADELGRVPRVAVLVAQGDRVGRRAVRLDRLADELDDGFAGKFVRRVVLVGLALLDVEAVNAELLKALQAVLVEQDIYCPLQRLAVVGRTWLAKHLAPIRFGLDDLGFDLFFGQFVLSPILIPIVYTN